MYKLMIVDDNPYTCKEIMDMLDWNNLNIEILGTYGNGMKALACAQETPPDIILTDIRMPVFSGLEFAEQIRKIQPRVKVVFMSNYSEFDYSQKAIRIGAAGYILKPVDKDELLSIMQSLVMKMEQERAALLQNKRFFHKMNEMLHAIRQRFLQELLFGIHLEDAEKKIDELGLEYIRTRTITVLLLKILDLDNRQSLEHTDDPAVLLEKSVCGMETPYQKAELLQITRKEYAILLFDGTPGRKPEGQDSFKNHAVRFASDVVSEIECRCRKSVIIGISSASKDYMNMHALYRQAYEALNTIFYTNGNPVVCYEEIDEGNTTVPLVAEVYSDIRTIVRNGQDDEIEAFLDKYFSEELSAIPYARDLSVFIANTAAAIASCGEENSIYSNMPFIFENIDEKKSIKEIRKWLREFLYSVADIGKRQGTGGEKEHYVDMIKKVIHEHYHQQISIQEIAAAVYFSAGYANAVFKKETGSTIFEYLQLYRIQVAKELLSQTNYKIYEIAEKVGYVNATHFSITFKKLVGISPAEYRNKVVGQ